MNEEEIKDNYNAIVDCVNGELTRLGETEFSGISEVNYFLNYTQLINDILYKLKIEVDAFDVFVSCYRTYNHDNDFDSDYEFFNSNRELIEDIILNSTVIVGHFEEDQKTYITFDLHKDKFADSSFNDQKYLDVFDKVCRIYFWNRGNAFDYARGIGDFISPSSSLIGKKNLKKMAKKISKKAINNSLIVKDLIENDCAVKKYGSTTIEKVPLKEQVENLISFKDIDKNFIITINRFIGNYDIIGDINNYFRSLGKQNNKFIASLHKDVDAINEFVYQIKNKKITLPLEIPKKMCDVISFDSVCCIFENTLQINECYYNFLCDCEESIFQNSNSGFRLKLEECGYNCDLIDNSMVNFLCLYGCDETIEIIKFVKGLNYEMMDIYSPNGLYILVNTSMEIVSMIDKLYNLNVISLKFIKGNPDIFFDKDLLEKYDGKNSLFVNNYSLISKYDNVKNVDNLLLYNTNNILSLINMLSHYDLDFNKNLLLDVKNFNYVDILIEFGCLNVLKNNVLVINEKIETILKRIYVSKLMRLDYVHNMEFCDFILTGKNFCVPDSKLDDFVINNVDDYMDKDMLNILNNCDRTNFDDVDKYDSYLIDDSTYKFGDILISKNKFLRNCNCLLENGYVLNNDVLFNSLIYGSVMDYEQLNYLKDYVYKKGLIKK